MSKAISAQDTRMYLENPNAPTTGYGNVVSATRSRPCVVVLDSVSDLMDGQPLTISGTNFQSLNNQSFVAQNIDPETKAVVLANSDTTNEPDAFVNTNARYSVSAFFDVCVVSYQINKSDPQKIATTKLCDDAEQFESGDSDPGTLTCDFFINPVDTDYQALLAAEEDGRVRMFMIVYRNGAIRTFPVIVDSISEAGGVNQAVQGTANLRVVSDAVLTMPPGEVTPTYVLIANVTPDAVVQPGEVTMLINEIGGAAESFDIYWGDGALQTTANNVVAHTYERPGIFRATIYARIAGELGAPWLAQNSVRVEPAIPYSALATVVPQSGVAPLFVTLGIAEVNHEAESFNVDWGDGSTQTLIGPIAVHTFAESGTYQISVVPVLYGMLQATLYPPLVEVAEPVQGVIGTVIRDHAQANGDATNLVRFYAFDSHEQPIATLLTITTNGLDVLVHPESAMTDPVTGLLYVEIASREATIVTVLATALGFFEIRGNVDVTFVPPIADEIEGIDAAEPVPADGIVQAEVTFIVVDTVGAPVANTLLDFTTDSATAMLSVDDELTDQNGRASVTVTNTVAEDVTVAATARAGGAHGTANVTFAPLIYAPSLTATVTTNDVEADGELANVVTFAAFDSAGAPLAGAYVVSTTDNPSAFTAPPIGLTDAHGELAVSVMSFDPGDVEVTGTSNGATASAVVHFLVLHRLTTITGVDGNGYIDAPGPLVIVFTAFDQAGLIMEGVELTLTTDSATALFDDGEGGHVPTLVLTTDANGQVFAELFNGTAEDVTVTASANFRWTDVQTLPTVIIEDAAARFRIARFGITRFGQT